MSDACRHHCSSLSQKRKRKKDEKSGCASHAVSDLTSTSVSVRPKHLIQLLVMSVRIQLSFLWDIQLRLVCNWNKNQINHQFETPKPDTFDESHRKVYFASRWINAHAVFGYLYRVSCLECVLSCIHSNVCATFCLLYSVDGLADAFKTVQSAFIQSNLILKCFSTFSILSLEQTWYVHNKDAENVLEKPIP